MLRTLIEIRGIRVIRVIRGKFPRELRTLQFGDQKRETRNPRPSRWNCRAKPCGPRAVAHSMRERSHGTKEGAMPILTKLRQFLDRNKVTYEVASHPQAFTAQEVAQAQHTPGRELAKVVMLRSGAEFLMAVLPAPYRIDLEPRRDGGGQTDLQLASEQEFAGLFPSARPVPCHRSATCTTSRLRRPLADA